jgi:hypothetical protein
MGIVRWLVTLYSFDSSTKLVGLNDTETPDNIPDTLVDAQTLNSVHKYATQMPIQRQLNAN